MAPSFSEDINAEIGIINELPPILNGLGVGDKLEVGTAVIVGEGVGDSLGVEDGLEDVDGDCDGCKDGILLG